MQIDPAPFTFRSLLWMHHAHQRSAWDHTAAAIAVHCAGVNPNDLNPYRKSKRSRDAYGSQAIEAEYERLKARDARRQAATTHTPPASSLNPQA